PIAALGSSQIRLWREPDSNRRSRVRKSGWCQVPAIRPGVGRTLTLGGGAESSPEGRDIELSVSPKDIRTSPYDLRANRSDRRQSREGDRWFESTFLQHQSAANNAGAPAHPARKDCAGPRIF